MGKYGITLSNLCQGHCRSCSFSQVQQLREPQGEDKDKSICEHLSPHALGVLGSSVLFLLSPSPTQVLFWGQQPCTPPSCAPRSGGDFEAVCKNKTTSVPLEKRNLCFVEPVHAGHCRPHPSLLPPALQPAAGQWQGVRRKTDSGAAPQPLACGAGGLPHFFNLPLPFLGLKRSEDRPSVHLGWEGGCGQAWRCHDVIEPPQWDRKLMRSAAPLPYPRIKGGCRAETPKPAVGGGGEPCETRGKMETGWKQPGHAGCTEPSPPFPPPPLGRPN